MYFSLRINNNITGDLEAPERDTMIKQNVYSNVIVSRQSWREDERTDTPPTLMSYRAIKKNTEQYKAKKKREKISILSYHLHQIEKNNCLGRTELARGKTLKSCHVFLKTVFLAECVEYAIYI